MLPLQGFCNAGVYAVTSRRACGELWREVRGGRVKGGDGDGGGGGGGGAVGLEEWREREREGTGKLQRLKEGLGSGNGNGNGNGKGETRLERFTTRRASERLESDDSSVASLRG